jgi:hypothetical protein
MTLLLLCTGRAQKQVVWEAERLKTIFEGTHTTSPFAAAEAVMP